MRGVGIGITLAFAGAIAAAPASAGKGPTYAELPASQLGARPAASAKPKSVSARESIPGVKTKVFEKASVLAFDTTTGKAATKVSELGGCIGVGPANSTEWDGPLDAESHNRPQAGVLPIRAEKVVDNADGTTKLEVTDAWFDTRSRGLRVIGKSTLALKPYATIPGGTRILAGRDEHGGKKFVQFVVTEAKDTPAYLLAEERARISHIGTSTTTQLLGMCGHHRVGLPTGGPGESATFDLKVILPALAAGEKSNVVSEMGTLSEAEKKGGVRDVRRREVRIQVGVSQTSRDKDPILSVSTEWVNDEVIERVYTEREATFQTHRSFSLDSVADLDEDPFDKNLMF